MGRILVLKSAMWPGYVVSPLWVSSSSFLKRTQGLSQMIPNGVLLWNSAVPRGRAGERRAGPRPHPSRGRRGGRPGPWPARALVPGASWRPAGREVAPPTGPPQSTEEAPSPGRRWPWRRRGCPPNYRKQGPPSSSQLAWRVWGASHQPISVGFLVAALIKSGTAPIASALALASGPGDGREAGH